MNRSYLNSLNVKEAAEILAVRRAASASVNGLVKQAEPGQLQQWLEAIRNAGSGAFDAAKGMGGDAWNKLKEYGGNAWDAVPEGSFKDLGNAVRDAKPDLSVATQTNNMPKYWEDVGHEALRNALIGGGIGGGLGALRGALSDDETVLGGLMSGGLTGATLGGAGTGLYRGWDTLASPGSHQVNQDKADEAGKQLGVNLNQISSDSNQKIIPRAEAGVRGLLASVGVGVPTTDDVQEAGGDITNLVKPKLLTEGVGPTSSELQQGVTGGATGAAGGAATGGLVGAMFDQADIPRKIRSLSGDPAKLQALGFDLKNTTPQMTDVYNRVAGQRQQAAAKANEAIWRNHPQFGADYQNAQGQLEQLNKQLAANPSKTLRKQIKRHQKTIENIQKQVGSTPPTHTREGHLGMAEASGRGTGGILGGLKDKLRILTNPVQVATANDIHGGNKPALTEGLRNLRAQKPGSWWNPAKMRRPGAQIGATVGGLLGGAVGMSPDMLGSLPDWSKMLPDPNSSRNSKGNPLTGYNLGR